MSDNEMITCTFDHDPDTPVVKVPVDDVMCHNVDRVGYLKRELAEKTGHEWDRLVIIDPATGNPVRSINAHGGDTYSVVVAPPPTKQLYCFEIETEKFLVCVTTSQDGDETMGAEWVLHDYMPGQHAMFYLFKDITINVQKNGAKDRFFHKSDPHWCFSIDGDCGSEQDLMFEFMYLPRSQTWVPLAYWYYKTFEPITKFKVTKVANVPLGVQAVEEKAEEEGL